MARYHGKNSRVLLSTTGTGTAITVASLKSWSYDRSVDTVETSSFADTNKTYVQGLPDAKGAFTGFWDDSETKLLSASSSGDGCKIYMYPDFTNAPTKYIYGPAWLSVSFASDITGAVTVDANWVANGAFYNGL